MTFAKLMKLYRHYKNEYDFKLKRVSYSELEQRVMESEEWIPDQEDRMEKVKCPVCDNTLIFVDHILGEIKCQRCKKIIKIDKESSKEHSHTEVQQLPNTYL